MVRALSILVIALMSVAEASAQAPNVVTTESTLTATVDRIEKSSRTVTLRSDGNIFKTVYVEPSVKAFDDLQRGDVVTVRYTESVVVQVRPGAALSDARDTTAEAQKKAGSEVVEQSRAVVTIESIDAQGLSIEYRTADGRRILRRVLNKQLLQGLRAGDRVEVTLTQERAVSIVRTRR